MDKCSFCGRDKRDTNLLIAGISGHICDNCVEQAYEIVQEETKKKAPFDVNNIKLLKPKEIKKFLDLYVMGQEDAKKTISVAVYNHYKRLMQTNRRDQTDDVEIEKSNIILVGETGTGKEVFAKAIQKESLRTDKAFITLNCAALPEALIESELFGHKKGSFTGATANTQGLFQAADGGTLFLDEINSLPVSIQAKLLRFLESGECLAVGDIKPYNVDVRIIAATNSDLNAKVASGEFRQDLYYRINVIDLHVPSLRERPEDLPELIDHILGKLMGSNSINKPTLSDCALKALQHYDFPGNVRELENILERALALYEGDNIELKDLNLPTKGVNHVMDNRNCPSFNPDESSLEDYLEKIERNLLTRALEENKWNKTAAAKQLGLSFRSFRYRLARLNLDGKD